jgi:hypothetical protein
MDSFARQRLLAAVGDAGQERIARGHYVVGSASALGSGIEREYLLRAGARDFGAPGGPSAAFAHAAHFRDATARDFAEGTWRALAQLKSALEQTP